MIKSKIKEQLSLHQAITDLQAHQEGKTPSQHSNKSKPTVPAPSTNGKSRASETTKIK